MRIVNISMVLKLKEDNNEDDGYGGVQKENKYKL